MRLTKDEERRVEEILRPYRENKKVQMLKKYPHHGRVTTYEHVNHVVQASYLMNRRWHLGADEQTLLVAALLHDFYLYDWHQKEASHRRHMFTHPETARRNAVENFQIGLREQRIIRSHMWPVTPFNLPTSREAWIVTMADKYCAIVEVVRDRRQRLKRRG